MNTTAINLSKVSHLTKGKGAADGDIDQAEMFKPTGWSILIEMMRPREKTEGGIYLTDESVDAQDYLGYCARVVAMGPLCYQGEKFGVSAADSAWCKVGDWVIVGAHAGQQIKTRSNRIFRMVNDEHVKCIVTDPSILKNYI